MEDIAVTFAWWCVFFWEICLSGDSRLNFLNAAFGGYQMKYKIVQLGPNSTAGPPPEERRPNSPASLQETFRMVPSRASSIFDESCLVNHIGLSCTPFLLAPALDPGRLRRLDGSSFERQ